MKYDNIFDALYKGTLDDIKNFFDQNPNTNANLSALSGRTPLFSLISSTRTIELKREIASYVISKGADVDVQDNLGDTPFFLAMSCGKTELGMIFLELGASKTNTDQDGKTPLMAAASAGSMKMISFILSEEDGMNTLNFKSTSEKTALFYSLEMGYVDIANYLLDLGADATHATEEGNALHFAAIHGDVALINRLVDNGANPNLTNELGMMPLHMACVVNDVDIYGNEIKITEEKFNNQKEKITKLIQLENDVNAQIGDNDEFCTILHVILGSFQYDDLEEIVINNFSEIQKSRRLDLIKFLVENGADPTLKDSKGRTPADSAKQMGLSEIADFLETHSQVAEISVETTSADILSFDDQSLPRTDEDNIDNKVIGDVTGEEIEA